MITLSAGIHRQIWIAGYPVFLDVQIDNRSGKVIQRLELQLEKATTYNALAAARTNLGRQFESLRVPDEVQREIIVRKDISDGLKAIVPKQQEIRTCQLVLPSDLVTIKMGAFAHRILTERLFADLRQGDFLRSDIS